MESEQIVLAIGFFIIAMIYASAGFGGGSSYLALLALPLFALAPPVIRPIALLCNIVVVSNGVFLSSRAGFIPWKEALLLIVGSIPFAYLGGRMALSDKTFFLVLGITLFLAALALFFQPVGGNRRILAPWMLISIGAAIGFLSGLVSIGGGIFLAPILHFIHWRNAKEIAAVAGFFILINSISGLAGQMQSGGIWSEPTLMLILVGAVFAGGQLGSRAGISYLNPGTIKKITAALIFIASVFILKDKIL